MSDIGLPWWMVLLAPFLTTPGWALASFVVAGWLTYRCNRGRNYRWLLAFVAATAASIGMPLAGVLLLDAGLPAISCLLVGLGVALVVFYLKRGPSGEG